MLTVLGLGAVGGLLDGHAAVGVEVDFVFGGFIGGLSGSLGFSTVR